MASARFGALHHHARRIAAVRATDAVWRSTDADAFLARLGQAPAHCAACTAEAAARVDAWDRRINALLAGEAVALAAAVADVERALELDLLDNTEVPALPV